jgi:tRNA modification GTPase
MEFSAHEQNAFVRDQHHAREIMASPQDTIMAVATPLGEGGLGVIRVSGTEAVSIVQSIFRSPKIKDLSQATSHTCYVGMIVEPSPGLRRPLPSNAGRGPGPAFSRGDAGEGGRRPDEGTIDQVVVTVFRAPHSYTGEDVIEISAHGSPFTLQKILNTCLAKGGRLAGPGEFTQRAFLNGKLDLTQAEAVAELIRAKSDKTQAAALAQLRGGLAQKVRGLRDQLLPLLAHIEVGLDHSDEDHDFLSRSHLAERCRIVQTEIETLLQSVPVSKILRQGLRVAFLGRPNVGKSSLLNALLKEDRAIVTATPGTTRDTLEESVNWDGIPVILTDTAGLRENAQDPIERLGMERTRKSLSSADVVIGLFDGSQELSPEDERVIQEAVEKPHIWVINKSDLPPRLTSSALNALNGQALVVNLSAKTGEGVDSLVKTLTHFALAEKAQSSEAQWLLNTRHQAALERAKEALSQATAAAQKESFEECIALELQTALKALGEIIGETTTEELLGQIFSQFCIGK